MTNNLFYPKDRQGMLISILGIEKWRIEIALILGRKCSKLVEIKFVQVMYTIYTLSRSHRLKNFDVASLASVRMTVEETPHNWPAKSATCRMTAGVPPLGTLCQRVEGSSLGALDSNRK